MFYSRNFLCFLFHTIIFVYNFIVIVSFSMRFTDDLITKDIEDVIDELKPLRNFKFCYLTCWNFIFQLIFLVVAILEEFSQFFRIGHNKPWISLVNRIRTHLFFTTIFPITLLVSVSFWTMFLYNRELVYPKVIDLIVPWWMNHAMHSLIILPLIVEILTQNPNNYKIQFKTALKPTFAILAVYNVVFVYIYLVHGLWLYNMFYLMDPLQIGLLFSFLYFLVTVFVYTGVKLQKVKKIKQRFR